ncbi:EAL domain-containing protein [Vibrio sp. 05-20-BW147]|uniref:EAL domain-containing protein n=1 Tax=Vibrio sp. 05-20-BW147 TaxID=2575834 RepID=UPI0015944BFC|nr:EAL domain-containing protein [Vibrio sp. 05-20-BW147]
MSIYVEKEELPRLCVHSSMMLNCFNLDVILLSMHQIQLLNGETLSCGYTFKVAQRGFKELSLVHILTSQADFESHLQTCENGVTCAYYGNLFLCTAYHPLFDKRFNIMGLEALLRVRTIDGEWVNPGDLFAKRAFGTDEYYHQINLDRLARVLHFRNFSLLHLSINLFVNLLPATALSNLKSHGQALVLNRLKELGIKREQIVNEILEHEVDSTQEIIELRKAIIECRQNGLRVAVDDYGADGSDDFRVQSLQPDIIKIDRNILLQYLSGQQNSLLRGIELAKQLKCMVVIEGIETREQLLAMQALDTHFYQGFYLAKPKLLDKSTDIDNFYSQLQSHPNVRLATTLLTKLNTR